MTNKYAYGTILGTAFLAFAKSKGSIVRLTNGYFIKSRTFPSFYINLKITDEFRKTKIKENCKGDEKAIAVIEETYKEGYLTKSEAEKMIQEAKTHQSCIKNNKGQCLWVVQTNKEKIKELAQKIMTMNAVEGPLRKNLMMITHVCGKPLWNTLSWLESEIQRSVLKGSNESRIYLEVSGNPPFCIPGKIDRVPGEMYIDDWGDESQDEDLFRASDEFIEELQKELIQKVSEIVNPFGFTVEMIGPHSILDGFQDDNVLEEILENIYGNKTLLVHKNGEWVPYNAPKMNKIKLRKR